MKRSSESVICDAIEEAQTLLGGVSWRSITDLADMVVQTYRRGGNVFICGNGGSHADALHFAEELTGRFQKDRKPLGALALGESCHTTCVANDYGFEQVFSRQLRALARPSDSLILLSTSGDSANIMEAYSIGRHIIGLRTFALLGRSGGLVGMSTVDRIIIPSQSSARIQEVHMTILHIMVELVEREMFPENYLEG